MSSANPSDLETNGNECLESKVPKSESSSSGVNEISDSSNNSIDDYNSRLKDVAEREKNGDIPAFKDVMDLCKFGYILQQTELKSGDLNAVPKGAHELWSDLKDALIKRPVLLGCYDPRRQVICNCCETEGQHKCDDSHKDNLSRVDPVAKRDTASHLCPVDEVLGRSLDEVMKQGLLDPLLPYLTSINSSTNSTNVTSAKDINSSSSGPNNTTSSSLGAGQRPLANIGGAESSSKEDEDLSRANSASDLSGSCIARIKKMDSSPSLRTKDGVKVKSGLYPSDSKVLPKYGSYFITDSLPRPNSLPRSNLLPRPNRSIRKSLSSGALTKNIPPSKLPKSPKSRLVRIRRNREVIIHVCDETRDAKKDFRCPQDLLLSQMGYFRDITSGQSLEDVDISVHCDVTIFEWLMDWLKAQSKDETICNNNEEESVTNELQQEPELTPNNVVSILVSASFLKMGPLVDFALTYLHHNMNKVLVTTHNLNCLGEPLLTRLSHLYKPTEVEELMDRRDRVHSRLYTKLIVSLVEPNPQPDREIFQTAATLYRCKICGLYLTQQLAKTLPCHPFRSVLNRRGEVVPKHQRDPHFNLNDFLRNLRSELKSWRKVFWRLWGMCHTLYCSLCSSYFPVYMHEFCSFHPQDPEFPSIQFKNSTQPFGAFICCQMPINRFQPLPANQKGCQSRDHRVKVRNETDSKVFKVLMANRDLICLCPSRKSTIKIAADASSITLPSSLNKDIWHLADDLAIELSLIPPRKRRGLVNRTLWETLRSSVIQRVLKKSIKIPSLFSAVQAAKAQQLASGNSSNSPEPKFGKLAYGRLKRAPKLPSKPALQSSESSSDLSGSEESSSSGDEPENEQNNGKDEQSNVSILGGHGTEDDDNDIDINKTKSNASKTGDLCIEIKLGKDNEKSKTLLAASAFLKAASGSTGIKSPSTESTSGRSGTSDSSSWMRWDGERTNRANQDYQREREEIAMRDLLRHLARRQQHLARQHAHQNSHPAQQYIRPIASAPNLTALHGPPFGGIFLRLEQDWRETHMAYLQHRSTAAQNTLTINNKLSRPNSSASLRSSRYSRGNRH